VRSGLEVPTFATRRLHACHHSRAPSGGGWNFGREMSGNFA
jgi:sterol desaturase/sphingolipid hydroxylase (fatty acid hydroxylase superfamily)